MNPPTCGTLEQIIQFTLETDWVFSAASTVDEIVLYFTQMVGMTPVSHKLSFFPVEGRFDMWCQLGTLF